MGTRADFYVGRGKSAKWLGSIAWDGYPEGIEKGVLTAKNEGEFLKYLDSFFSGRNDYTPAKDGWPWPWKTSSTTDFAYALDCGKVWASCFGSNWFDPLIEDGAGDIIETDIHAEFPDFNTEGQAKAGSIRSGVIAFSG